jgi:hypothetical protein
MGEMDRDTPLIAEASESLLGAASSAVVSAPAPAPAAEGFFLRRWGRAALRWVVRLRWRLLAVAALLALIGGGVW